MKRVLVTGTAGFIGSAVVEALLADGQTVVCGVDNFDPIYDRSFKEGNLREAMTHERFSFHECDIVDQSALRTVFLEFKPTHVLHLAAKADTRAAVENPYEYVQVNIIGTLNVLELAREYGVAHIVAASSSSVYGNNPQVPWQESDRTLDPISPYGVTKLSTEHMAYSYHVQHGTSITMLRYFNVYGEKNRPGMVPYIWAEAFLKKEPISISGDGSRERDYTYIGDIVAGTIAALLKPLGFAVLNLGHGSPLSLNQLKEVFEKVTGHEVPVTYRPSHKASVDRTFADITKTKELLGWQPTTSHEEGITRLLEWFRTHRLEETK